MKKGLFIGILLSASTTIFAIEPVQFGAVAALNVSDVSVAGYDNNAKIGFSAGVTGKANFQGDEGVFLQASALLSLRGAKYKFYVTDPLGNDYRLKGMFNPYYIDVPIHVGYTYGVNDDYNFFISAGPMLSFGIFGKDKYDDLVFNDKNEKYDKVTEKSDIFSDEGGWKRFDLGLGFKIGCEFFESYVISLGYDWGLLDVTKYNSAQSQNFQVALMYLF